MDCACSRLYALSGLKGLQSKRSSEFLVLVTTILRDAAEGLVVLSGRIGTAVESTDVAQELFVRTAIDSESEDASLVTGGEVQLPQSAVRALHDLI